MQPNTSSNIDIIRLLASMFWIGGAVLTFVVALESFQQSKTPQTDNICEVKYEIERMGKEFQMQLEKLKNKL